MKQYSFVEPLQGCDFVTLEVVVTEQDILNEYFEYYKTVMKNIGKEDEINEQQCIDDFLIVNWAEEIEHPELDTYSNGVVRMDCKTWKEYRNWLAEQEEE